MWQQQCKKTTCWVLLLSYAVKALLTPQAVRTYVKKTERKPKRNTFDLFPFQTFEDMAYWIVNRGWDSFQCLYLHLQKINTGPTTEQIQKIHIVVSVFYLCFISRVQTTLQAATNCCNVKCEECVLELRFVVAFWQGRQEPLNFGLSENLFFIRKFLSSNAKFEAENLYFGEILVPKLKFWASIVSEIVSQKNCNFLPSWATFLNPDAAGVLRIAVLGN